MLIIDITRDDCIVIGNVVVQIAAVHGEKVRLGVTAPKDVRVDRAEVAARREGR